MTGEVRKYLQKIQLIYGAQLLTLISFSIIAYFFRTVESTNDSDLLLYVLAIFMIIALIGSNFIFRILIQRARKQPSLTQMLAQYTTASIVRLALLESAGLFAAVVVLVTGNLLAYIGTALILASLITYLPTPVLLAKELYLDNKS